MCTLIAALHQYPDAPLVVAANRDELLDRPARPALLWTGGPQPFIAGRDERGGGTWLGLNRAGLFVGVTNRFGVGRDERRASRGALVVDALGAASAAELHHRLSALAADRYNAFHLLYADRHQAFVTWSDGAAVRQQALAPGVHIVTERSLGGDDRARTETLREQWQRLPPGPGPSPGAESLLQLLRFHREGDPLGSICVHAPALGYGTRSSCVLKLGAAAPELWWVEGPPCRNQARRLDAEVAAMLA